MSVAHCGELSSRHVRWFQDNNVGVLDLCDVEAMGDRDEAGNNLNTILGASEGANRLRIVRPLIRYDSSPPIMRPDGPQGCR